jgi:hypothetical protein
MVKYKYGLHFEISGMVLQQIHHQHFMASLVILVFTEPNSFVLVPKQTFLPSSKSMEVM